MCGLKKNINSCPDNSFKFDNGSTLEKEGFKLIIKSFNLSIHAHEKWM